MNHELLYETSWLNSQYDSWFGHPENEKHSENLQEQTTIFFNQCFIRIFKRKQSSEIKVFIMKFLSWAAGRSIIDLNLLNDKGGVVNIALFYFRKICFFQEIAYFWISKIAYFSKIAYLSKIAYFLKIAHATT